MYIHIQVYIDPNNRAPVDLQVEDLGTGEYTVAYTAPHASGRVRVSVAVDGGKHIFNSPFPTLISPGEAFPPNCEAAGVGLSRGGCGMDVVFLIHARDAAGNHLIDGGLTWAVRVQPEAFGGNASGFQIDVAVTDHHNGVYTCTFRPQVAGKHTVRVQLKNKHVRGSPFTTRIFEVPEWEAAEVAQFIAQIGFPQYCAAFINEDIRGFALANIDQDMLEHELGIYLKGHQSRIVSEVKRRVANDSIDDDDEIARITDPILVRLGVGDHLTRANVRAACQADTDKAEEMTDPESGAMLQRLRLELYGHSEELVQELHDIAEVAVSTTSQEMLTELYSGQTKDAFGISRALRSLESTLKQNMETKVRAATVKDDDGEGGGDDANLDSRPETGASALS